MASKFACSYDVPKNQMAGTNNASARKLLFLPMKSRSEGFPECIVRIRTCNVLGQS